MTDTASTASLLSLADEELLSLYLSLSPTNRDEVFISTVQAADLTGVSMRTIQLWAECGTVRAILIGRKYRILLESLREHLRCQMSRNL